MGELSNSAVHGGDSTDARSIWIELTNKCNLACVHCYNSSSSDAEDATLDEAQYRTVIDEAAQAGFKSIQFIGGEPTVSKSLIPLMTYAARSGIKEMEVYSNLFALGDRLLDTAKECDARFATSFYSADENIHDSITQRKGSFVRTSKNIARLSGEKISVRAGFIEMDENKGQFESTARYLNNLGVEQVRRDRVRRFGRASDGASDPFTELCGHCGQGSLCVNYDGTISPCIMSKFVQLGTVGDDPLAYVMLAEPLRQFRERLQERLNDNQCPPQCEPVCNPRCSPNCQPCFPAGKCNPELFG